MSARATHRLIDAAAALPPADRALLNLWVHRNLGDEELAALAGMSVASLTERRTRIVTGLGTVLGLPAPDVLTALRALEPAGSNGKLDPAGGASTADTAGGANEGEAGAVAVSEPAGVSSPPTSPTSAPATSPARSHRGIRRPLLAALMLVVAAAALIALLASGGSSPTRPGSRSDAAAPPHPAVVRPSAPRSVRHTLGGLPGGLANASGSVDLARHGSRLTLRLTVSKLPPPGTGHREVWLYNSVLDSRALGRLAITGAVHAYPLPATAARYRWIDVSLQPRGAVAHSGESQLRAPNPAYRLGAVSHSAGTNRRNRRR